MMMLHRENTAVHMRQRRRQRPQLLRRIHRTTTPLLLLLLSSVFLSGVAAAEDDFVFTDTLLERTVAAVRLSLVAYTDDGGVLNIQNDHPNSKMHQQLKVYHDNPDQAAVTKLGSVCYAAFRGTNFFNWRDLVQNLKLGNREVCVHGECCRVESGFYDGYHTNYRKDLETDVRKCVASCGNDNCPLILTGHSQG